MAKTLEAVILIYKNKSDRLYSEHKQNLDNLLIEFKEDEKEYIKHYIQEVDHYIKKCNDLRSEFIIDSINATI